MVKINAYAAMEREIKRPETASLVLSIIIVVVSEDGLRSPPRNLRQRNDGEKTCQLRVLIPMPACS